MKPFSLPGIPPRPNRHLALFCGGDGLSPERAVRFRLHQLPARLRTLNYFFQLEILWLQTHYGLFKLGKAEPVQRNAPDPYHLVHIELLDGSLVDIYFDATDILESVLPKRLLNMEAVRSFVANKARIRAEQRPRTPNLPPYPVKMVLRVLLGLLLFAAFFGWSCKATDLTEHSLWTWLTAGGMLATLGWIFWLTTVSPYLISAGWKAQLSSFGTALLLGLLPMYEVWGVLKACASAAVTVENHSTTTVRMELNSRHWLTLRPGDTATMVIHRRGGTMTFLDASTGAYLSKAHVEAMDRGPYLLNVLGAATYYLGEITYRPDGKDAVVREAATRDVWIYAVTDYLLKHPPDHDVLQIPHVPFPILMYRNTTQTNPPQWSAFTFNTDLDNTYARMFAGYRKTVTYLLRESLLAPDPPEPEQPDLSYQPALEDLQ